MSLHEVTQFSSVKLTFWLMTCYAGLKRARNVWIDKLTSSHLLERSLEPPVWTHHSHRTNDLHMEHAQSPILKHKEQQNYCRCKTLKPELKRYTLTHLPGEKQRGLIQRDSKRSHHNELKKKTKQQRYKTNQGKGHDDAFETLQIERSTSNFTSMLCNGVLLTYQSLNPLHPPRAWKQNKTKQHKQRQKKRTK